MAPSGIRDDAANAVRAGSPAVVSTDGSERVSVEGCFLVGRITSLRGHDGGSCNDFRTDSLTGFISGKGELFKSERGVGAKRLAVQFEGKNALALVRLVQSCRSCRTATGEATQAVARRSCGRRWPLRNIVGVAA